MWKKVTKWRTWSGMESIARVQQLTIPSNTSTREYQIKIVEKMFKANKGVGFSYSMYKI